MITANEIRTRFLDYFARQGHTQVSSSALVPRDDPSLLFTNAGMVQFKKTFLGQERRDYSRAASSQKCLRVGGKHNDLENVGRTARHHTFFEMLGNFSFGDYFKEEAIVFGWEFLTREIGLDKNRLYATVFLDDDEADILWRKVAGLPPERIFRLGEKDNFWSMGDTGPCGPCSEILFDQGEAMSCGPNCGIGRCDCDRYLEIWNLVFMQYNQDQTGTRQPLPRPSIDTGMGLERLTAICQGVQSNFETDLFRYLIDFAANLGKTVFHRDPETDTALRVISDHSRAIAFMVADGILPSNEGRGYVLRRLIRRAFRFGRLMGLTEPFLHSTCMEVVAKMGQAFPELVENMNFMARMVHEEEERFSLTLDKGLLLLQEEMETLRAKGKTTIAGAPAFKLYDTFGFPLDIINDVAGKEGFAVDEAGFNARMAKQKIRAKAAWKGSGEIDLAGRFKALLEEGLRSEFTGYSELKGRGRIAALLDENANPVESLSTGQKGYCVVSRTPFYGESGGQTGDTGSLTTPGGRARVTDALKPAPELTVHVVEIAKGGILRDQEAELVVEEDRRTATARNHTCTHLLHAALRGVLGSHVKQSGSLVNPERLRFDFTHITAMAPEEIVQVEKAVNRAVLADLPVRTEVMQYAASQEKGAVSLFDEKYGDKVRVVEVPGESMELCGGTHLRATGQSGPFVIVSESGVAAGIRRIEALTGWNALHFLGERRVAAERVAARLKARPGEVEERVATLQAETKTLRKEMERLESRSASRSGGGLMEGLEEVGGVKFLAAKVDTPNVKALRDLMDDLRSKLPSGVAALASAQDGKVSLLLYVSKELHHRFTAPQLIKDVATLVGGSGGGRPELAQSGGSNPAGIDQAFARLRELVEG